MNALKVNKAKLKTMIPEMVKFGDDSLSDAVTVLNRAHVTKARLSFFVHGLRRTARWSVEAV